MFLKMSENEISCFHVLGQSSIFVLTNLLATDVMLQHLQCQFTDELFQNADIQTRELKKKKTNTEYFTQAHPPPSTCPPSKAYRERMRAAGLEIQIGHPVDEVEEGECGGEEDACVRVYLCDADVQPPMPPRSRAAVLETAEEAGAVLPVQALVAVLLVALLHVRGVVHLNSCGRARADVYCGSLLFFFFFFRTEGEDRELATGLVCIRTSLPRNAQLLLSFFVFFCSFFFHSAAKCNLHLQLGAFLFRKKIIIMEDDP